MREDAVIHKSWDRLERGEGKDPGVWAFPVLLGGLEEKDHVVKQETWVQLDHQEMLGTSWTWLVTLSSIRDQKDPVDEKVNQATLGQRACLDQGAGMAEMVVPD
jgi:hypothetical protein